MHSTLDAIRAEIEAARRDGAAQQARACLEEKQAHRRFVILTVTTAITGFTLAAYVLLRLIDCH